MQRADIRRADLAQLVFEARFHALVRLLVDAPDDRAFQFFLHFGGGKVGKSDGEHARDLRLSFQN